MQHPSQWEAQPGRDPHGVRDLLNRRRPISGSRPPFPPVRRPLSAAREAGASRGRQASPKRSLPCRLPALPAAKPCPCSVQAPPLLALIGCEAAWRQAGRPAPFPRGGRAPFTRAFYWQDAQPIAACRAPPLTLACSAGGTKEALLRSRNLVSEANNSAEADRPASPRPAAESLRCSAAPRGGLSRLLGGPVQSRGLP